MKFVVVDVYCDRESVGESYWEWEGYVECDVGEDGEGYVEWLVGGLVVGDWEWDGMGDGYIEGMG